MLAACRRHRIRFSITVPQTKTVAAAIAAIGEHAWTDIDYPDGGVAQVAETALGGDRLVVRRTRLVGPQASLWPDWRYHALVTDRAGSAVDLDADHRRHAICELAIRALKDGAGLRHCPRATSWPTRPGWSSPPWPTICCVGSPPSGLAAPTYWWAKTLRRRLLHLPGRLTRSARRRLLHLPTDWPWATQFLGALTRLRAIPLRA